MKKQLSLLAALVAAMLTVALLAASPFATAQTPAPTPSCSATLDALAAAKAMPVGDVAAKQAALDALKQAQVPLDKAVVDAQKAFDTNTDPAQVAALQAALNKAKADAAAGQAKVDAAQKNLDADKKLVADRDKAVAAAQVAVDRACGGVTTTPPAPAPVVYADCAAVRAAGKAPILSGQPGYRAGLDSDGDGVGCEAVEGVVIPNAINTGVA